MPGCLKSHVWLHNPDSKASTNTNNKRFAAAYDFLMLRRMFEMTERIVGEVGVTIVTYQLQPLMMS